MGTVVPEIQFWAIFTQMSTFYCDEYLEFFFLKYFIVLKKKYFQAF